MKHHKLKAIVQSWDELLVLTRDKTSPAQRNPHLGTISQSNKVHRKTNFQYHRSDSYCGITLLFNNYG